MFVAVVVWVLVAVLVTVQVEVMMEVDVFVTVAVLLPLPPGELGELEELEEPLPQARGKRTAGIKRKAHKKNFMTIKTSRNKEMFYY